MTPWFHRGGLYSGGPNPVFYVGAEAVPLRAFDPAVVLDWVQEHALTFLIGAPTNLALLSAEQQERPRDLSSLHGIVTMGAPLDRASCLRYQELLTARIFNGYGTTEAFWNTFLRPADLPDHAGSAGRACTDDDVAVVRVYEDRTADPDDHVAKDGTEVGEVVVRSVKSGYAYVGQPEEQAARFRDGWLYIGDLATWDADEYVTIVGRKDDMIISGGENVHPTQVESVLNEHPGIADSAVVGVPDERWGELVVAYVVRSDPGVDAAACEAHCVVAPDARGLQAPARVPLRRRAAGDRHGQEGPLPGARAGSQGGRRGPSATTMTGDVVVTGIGAITPLGLDAPTTWEGLLAGRSGIGPITPSTPPPCRCGSPARSTASTRRGAARAQAHAALGALLPARGRRRARGGRRRRPGRRASEADDLGVVINNAVGGVPETRGQHRRAARRRPARRQRLLRPLDDPEHGRPARWRSISGRTDR